jgi:hypothetical protein
MFAAMSRWSTTDTCSEPVFEGYAFLEKVESLKYGVRACVCTFGFGLLDIFLHSLGLNVLHQPSDKLFSMFTFNKVVNHLLPFPLVFLAR